MTSPSGSATPARDDQPLVDALTSSQRRGMLGAAAIRDVIAHSEAFVEALSETTGTVVDLGSGGGVPGLVIAWRRPDLDVVLVDRRATRTDHLHRLVLRLGLTARVTVLTADAAVLPDLDARADAVVARGFGPPATVLATALPLLAGDGVIVVSEPPPTSRDRWPDALLERFAIERVAAGRRVAIFRRSPPAS